VCDQLAKGSLHDDGMAGSWTCDLSIADQMPKPLDHHTVKKGAWNHTVS